MTKILSSITLLSLSLIVVSIPHEGLANTNSTVIHNSVSASANGGESVVKVRTVHNGEVIEDTTIASSTPIHYESNHTSEDSIVNTSVSATTNTTNTSASTITSHNDTESLTLLLNNLLILLDYYEKLLLKQNQ